MNHIDACRYVFDLYMIQAQSLDLEIEFLDKLNEIFTGDPDCELWDALQGAAFDCNLI